jgi:CheY-like chemotaxis protein
MSESIRILIVEDNEDMFEAYDDAALELSSEEQSIVLERESSADEAQRLLLSNNYDGAIVDLNLDQGKPEEASGNEVLKRIVESHRFPVLVVSGNLQNLDDSIKAKESSFLKFFVRETSNKTIFEYLLKIHETGITRILGGRGQIEQLLGEIFWRHLACGFDNWDAGDRDSERTLLRYTVAHLAEYLDIPNGEDRFYHEAEFYISPSIREHISTGDVVEFEGERYILLSPACDVAVRGTDHESKPIINADRVLLAPLIRLSRDQFIEHGIISADDNGSTREKKLNEIMKGQREKYIFLPECGDMYAAVVDLQNIYTWEFNKYLDASRKATVSGIFLKDIQSRFSSYYGRQGQPDLEKTKLLRQYKAKISPNK